MDISTTIKLNNGIEMPLLGLGTWKMGEGEGTVRAIQTALDIGYRLIDTATMYANEESVGEAVRGSDIPRKEIFVTTKVWPTDFSDPQGAFETSLRALGLDYVDLYLIHWPIPFMPKSVWQALEKICEQKLVRAIGVSNYSIADIEKLLSYASVPPTVNQIKFNPFDYGKDILEYCLSEQIVVEAYSPLTEGRYLGDARIGALAKKYQKSPAQIMIRWALQHGTIVIPKSSRREHIRENADVFDFEISTEDMATLDALS